MKDKELEIALNHDNIMTFKDYINTRIAYETVYQEKDKEIEKLNNIISELEKDLEEKIDEDRLNILSNSHWKYVLDKLQELKGSDK